MQYSVSSVEHRQANRHNLCHGMGGGSGPRKAIQVNQNYNYPVVALKGLTEYQPHDYQFTIEERSPL